jgi:hypothetical protein
LGPGPDLERDFLVGDVLEEGDNLDVFLAVAEGDLDLELDLELGRDLFELVELLELVVEPNSAFRSQSGFKVPGGQSGGPPILFLLLFNVLGPFLTIDSSSED